MRYSLAEREDLARRREQWILRTEHGEDPERVRRELKLKVKIGTLVGLKPRYQKGGRTWQALLERRHGLATKGTPAVMTFVTKAKARNPHITAGELVTAIWEQFEIEISVNQLSELLKPLGLSNPVGRPRPTSVEPPAQTAGRDVDHAGAFFPPGRTDRTRRAGGRAGRR